MSNTIYLYLKTHNKTGLKYLGKTVKDPFLYSGSGKYWLRHLKKNGDDVTTEILFESEDIEEIKEKGLHYSNLWDVVNSTEFANLIPEYGTGGDTSMTFTEETKEKIRISLAKYREGKDLSQSEESKERKRIAQTGKKYSEESKKKMSESATKRGFNGYGFIKGHKSWNEGICGFMSDRKWVNNGIENKRINLSGDIPEGFVLGRTPFSVYESETCPYCGKIGKGGSMKRWHFNNCKNKL